MIGNGDTTPPEAQHLGAIEAAEKRARAAAEIARLDARALAERACRDAFAAGVEAGVAAEYAKAASIKVDQIGEVMDLLSLRYENDALARVDRDAAIMVELGRINTHLGMVKAEQRKARASKPEHGVDFAALVFDREDTEVRRIKAELAHVERLRAEAAARRADLWRGAKRVAVLSTPAVVAIVIAVLAALKGWLK